MVTDALQPYSVAVYPHLPYPDNSDESNKGLKYTAEIYKLFCSLWSTEVQHSAELSVPASAFFFFSEAPFFSLSVLHTTWFFHRFFYYHTFYKLSFMFFCLLSSEIFPCSIRKPSFLSAWWNPQIARLQLWEGSQDNDQKHAGSLTPCSRSDSEFVFCRPLAWTWAAAGKTFIFNFPMQSFKAQWQIHGPPAVTLLSRIQSTYLNVKE